MVNIEEYLRQNKPEISDSTVSAYTVNLEKLHDRLHGTRSFEDLEWLKDSAAVLESLQKHCVSYLTQRNYLNAVVVILLNRDGFQTALHTYQAHRDKFNDQYMEIQQTKEPSAKQAQNWVPLNDIRELIDEYDEHAKLLRNHADINLKDKVAMQDRFMLHFWTTYPMRNDLHDTRVITKRVFNALDQVDKDNKNYIIVGKEVVLSIGNYKTRKKCQEDTHRGEAGTEGDEAVVVCQPEQRVHPGECEGRHPHVEPPYHAESDPHLQEALQQECW